MSGPLDIGLAGRDAAEVDVARHGEHASVAIDGRRYHGSLRPAGDGYELTLEDRTERVWILVEGDVVWVHAFGRAWEVAVVDPIERSRAGAVAGDVATAPMPGTVITVSVAPGDDVRSGQTLIVIESMKMQSEIIAERDGTVARVHLGVGDTFDRGAVLVALEPLPEEG